MLLILLLSVPALLLRYVILRKPLHWGIAAILSLFFLLIGLMVTASSNITSKYVIPASTAISFLTLIAKKKDENDSSPSS